MIRVIVVDDHAVVRGGVARVLERVGDSVLVIGVADNGIGIEPEYRESIFEVFRRLHTDEEHPGTGIGLAIVRKAARLMGTEVSLDSTPGVGSTFSLGLPAAPGQAAAP